jgi:hypothetical protein
LSDTSVGSGKPIEKRLLIPERKRPVIWLGVKVSVLAQQKHFTEALIRQAMIENAWI